MIGAQALFKNICRAMHQGLGLSEPVGVLQAPDQIPLDIISEARHERAEA
jgi:hypothetical protein